MRQESLYVFALAVPTDQSIHRERVPKIVQPRAERAARWALQAGLLSHAFEHQLRGLTGDGPPVAIGQKRRVGAYVLQNMSACIAFITCSP